MLHNNNLNALAVYHNKYGHNFNLISVNWIRREKDSPRQICIDSSLISQSHTIYLRPGSYITSLIIAKQRVAQCIIRSISEINRDLLGLVQFQKINRN